MISTLKTNIDGFQALPWEGVERTAPAVIAVIDHALAHLRVDPAAGRLDTIKGRRLAGGDHVAHATRQRGRHDDPGVLVHA
jgi:hypothetical protein